MGFSICYCDEYATLKETHGIRKFQVIQDELNKISILFIIDQAVYSEKIERIFLHNWQDRVGTNMTIDLAYVEEIPGDKSGKFRMVKNNIKHLLN